MTLVETMLRIATREAYDMGLDPAQYNQDPRVHDFMRLVMNSWLEYKEASGISTNTGLRAEEIECQ